MEEWQDPEVILFWLMLGLIFLVILLVFIIVLTRLIIRNMVQARVNESNLQLKNQLELTEATIKAQELERERVAADVHDELIGKLNAIKLHSELGFDPLEYNITDRIEECISTARRISHDLSPPLIEYSTLKDIVDEVVEPYSINYNVNLTYDIRTNEVYENSFKVQILRILQETLVNIDKHAMANEVKIRLRQTEICLIILVADNGKGFNRAKFKSGLGLQNIETRTQYLGGMCKIKSVVNKGTRSIFYFKFEQRQTLR
ncbi:MAG: ATP-binding protein [Nonlabens sp.]